jgi:hypothetical protein
MPGKARRVAARQSQLNRRRKKQQRGPSGTPSIAPAQVQVDDRPTDEVAEQPEQATTPAPAPRRPSPVAAQLAPANPLRSARVRGERPDAYNYVGSEVRRILGMASVVVAALVALGILL